jgi:Domain of unknown function (DUF1992)
VTDAAFSPTLDDVNERKPPGMRSEDWVERQIREAAERGAFDNLPGAGKPIKGLDRPFTATSWAIDWVEREGGDLRALLPPLLALRRERAAFLAGLGQVASEEAVRDTVRDFNRRLLDQYRRPIEGPAVAVGVLDAEETVAAWRRARPVAPPDESEASGPGEPRRGRARRRWWGRRRG